MASYANQKTIILGHCKDIAHKQGTNDPFLQPTNWAPLKEAMRLLSGNGFKLYLYLLSWDGKGRYEFSPAGIAKETKMSDEGARKARDELIRLGFLISIDNNSYEFFPISRTTVS